MKTVANIRNDADKIKGKIQTYLRKKKEANKKNKIEGERGRGEF